uniref:ATP-dependent RNA helicase ddx46-like n=1 Tax=Erigeron canadensis TaxID=72917 RepID=UPI001CB8CA52|nr:ATP-dependent RNA helicase ddx46-like [Erigeron canadensis]
MEVSKSTSNEETLGSSTRVTEAQLVSSEVVPTLTNSEPTLTPVEEPASPPLLQQQQQQQQQNIIDHDPPYQPPPISHQHPIFPQGTTPAYVTSAVFQPSLQFLHPQIHVVPPRRTYDLPGEQEKELDSETESDGPSERILERSLASIRTTPFVASASTLTAAPLSMEAQLEKSQTEVQNLLIQVEGLSKSLAANTSLWPI